MQYSPGFIPQREVPRAAHPLFQHLADTYTSESNKVGAIWSALSDDQLDFRPHQRSSSIRQILIHQILSERRFFGEFIGFPEPPVESLLPGGDAPPIRAYVSRFIDLARSRLVPLTAGDEAFWTAEVPFFDVTRQRIWVFWRRVLHTAHHRAQIGVCLRLLGSQVPVTYGPTADVTWSGADPTVTLSAAGRTTARRTPAT
jgi:uncharacterized damage-inducible protein DinB